MKDMKIVVGLPAYNEEKNIAKIIVQLKKIFKNIVVCNDGSTDLTGEIAENLGVMVINHTRNLGYGASIRSLFTKAREIDADILVTFDADGQHRVTDIPKIIKEIEMDNADIVIGSRFSEGKSENVPKYRELGIKTITKVTNLSLKTKVTDSQSGFRAYNKKVLKDISPTEHGMGVSTEILIKANEKKFRITEIPITVIYEGDTSTHNPIEHGTSVLLSTIKFTSIEHPLKIYGIPGIIFLAIGLFFIVWTIQGFSETRQIITNISLIGIGSTIFGAIFLMTSIILYTLVNVVREK